MECPTCCRVRQTQGFNVVVDNTKPLCAACNEWEANKQYIESAEYQQWLASRPENLTMEQIIAWMEENPPPLRN